MAAGGQLQVSGTVSTVAGAAIANAVISDLSDHKQGLYRGLFLSALSICRLFLFHIFKQVAFGII